MTEPVDQASLISSLKRLVISFGPFIQNAGSFEQAEESLLHMEANDENFHRYEFVRWLRSQIDSQLGQLIDREMSKHSITPQEAIAGQETVIDTITRKIIKSQDFDNMTQKLKMDVTDACEYLVTNFPEEFTGEDYRTMQLQQEQGNHDPYNSISDIESSLGESSLNQSTFMFMNNEQFQRIAQDLDKKQPTSSRKEALQQLHQTPTLDALQCDWWRHIRQGLLDALTDNDSTVWVSALKFIARGFSSNSPTTKEIYTMLVEYMRMQFNISNKDNIPRLEDDLDCLKPELEKLLKAFRLMSEYQQQVSQYWIRYPDRFLEEVLESTLLLLSAHYSTAASGSHSQVTPIHLLALFDTKANWFTKWMHGNYSRKPLLKMMSRHKAFLEDAVRSIVAFMKNKRSAGPKKYDSPRTNNSGKYERSTQYTSGELEYLHFVHSLHIVSRTLCYCQGRDLFPVKVKNSEEPVTVTSMAIIMLELLTAPNAPKSYKLPAVQYDPGLLVTNVFKKLCMSESSCRHCVCVDGVTDVLLGPVSDIINGKQNTDVGEATLLQIADILSAIVSCSVGRQHLLCGKNLTSAKSSAVHILAEFTKLGMLSQFPSSVTVSKTVLGNFAYVCRQLYTTCEGLMMLSPYELHDCIAQAWMEAGREADTANTPTPSMEGQLSPGRDSHLIVLWEDSLRDTLLNFAGTPRGLLLLQQKGALVDCIYYMYSRQAQRLQVSKYEKYGYGYMISQVAATALGMAALNNSGFVMSLVRAIWSTVEIVSDQPLQCIHRSRCWPLGHDKVTIKHFNNIISLMSSFNGVYEILHGKALPTRDEYSFREFPVCVPGLLDRLVFVDTDAKIHALFNYEESHAFGLRLLSFLTTCLDTMLLLQAQYSFCDVLLTAQKANCLEDSSSVIIDMLSLERNYILVRTWLVGGPSERIIPSRDIEKNNKSDTIARPLFTSYPVPKEYVPSMNTKSSKQETDVSKYLSDTKKSEMNQAWLEKCKRAFCSTLTAKPDHAKEVVLQELLEKCVRVLSSAEAGNKLPLSDYSANDGQIKNFQLSAIQEEGIKVTLRYGEHLNIFSNQKDAKEKLSYLIKQTSLYLKQQQRNPGSNNPMLNLKDGYPGYDWFVATVFLLMDGNSDKAWKLLHQFSSMVASAYLWRQRLHCSIHQPESLAWSGIPPMLYTTCHNIELILQTDVTHVHSAFKMSGFAPAQICQQWLTQCFWNYLDWIEICHYISVCLLLGIDYQVYICVAILRYLQTDILCHMQQQSLITFLKEQPIRGFRVGEHLEYMQQLEKKFRSTILPDMMDLQKP